MVPELISFQLGMDWIEKLWAKLQKIRKKRAEEIEAINQIMWGNPLELARYYINPDGQEFNPADRPEEDFLVSREPLIKKVDQFFQSSAMGSPGSNQLFILADAGMGKSALLVMLKLLHLTSFWPRDKDCVLKKLGPNTLEEILAIPNQLHTILLLDSLDEDPCAFNRVHEYLLEILKASQNYHRVIITCRTQFFPDYQSDSLERPGRVSIGGYTCPAKYLAYFTDEQVAAYLKKRFPKKYRILPQRLLHEKAKTIVTRMGSLRLRPMLLAYIEELMDSPLLETNPDEFTLYKAIVTKWLEREQTKTKIPADTLFKASEVLASELMLAKKTEIPEVDLDALIAQHPNLQGLKEIDIKGRSLLNRNSAGAYRFAHLTIQEFLLAHRLLSDAAWEPRSVVTSSEFVCRLLVNRLMSEAETDVLNRLEHLSALRLVEAAFVIFEPQERVRFCNWLAEKGDPRFHGPELGYLPKDDHFGFIEIPAGEFLMGSDKSTDSLAQDNEQPQHPVTLLPYYLGKYPVTVAQFRAFVEATGFTPGDPDSVKGPANHPVVQVSWDEAMTYCAWLSEELHAHEREQGSPLFPPFPMGEWMVTLPTEAQWEKAARWDVPHRQSRRYPWGADWDANRANSQETGINTTSAVGCFPGGASPYGVEDMAGNVFEWCADWYAEDYFAASPGQDPGGSATEKARVVRGGCWFNGDPQFFRAANRGWLNPSNRNVRLGFRCVVRSPGP